MLLTHHSDRGHRISCHSFYGKYAYCGTKQYVTLPNQEIGQNFHVKTETRYLVALLAETKTRLNCN